MEQLVCISIRKPKRKRKITFQKNLTHIVGWGQYAPGAKRRMLLTETERRLYIHVDQLSGTHWRQNRECVWQKGAVITLFYYSEKLEWVILNPPHQLRVKMDYLNECIANLYTAFSARICLWRKNKFILTQALCNTSRVWLFFRKTRFLIISQYSHTDKSKRLHARISALVILH
jgi:hypothetical protein